MHHQKFFQNNQGTIAIAKSLSLERCKHVDTKHHFIRSTANNGKVLLEYCLTDEMVADLMSKPAKNIKLRKLTNIFFGHNSVRI